MSKAVSSVARSVTSVVSGAVKAVKSVASGVSNALSGITGSKLGKIAMLAAAIYFGGAAIAGGMGSSAAGGSFLSGMGTGVSSAASSLAGGWSGITSAWGTAGAAGTTAATEAAAANAGLLAGSQQSQMLAAQNAGFGSDAAAATKATNAAAMTSAPSLNAPIVSATNPVNPPAAGKSIFDSPYAAPAAIMGGSSIIGGVMQGKALENQRDYETEQARLARERYNANAGAQIFSGNQPTGTVPVAGAPSAGQYDPMAEIAAARARRYQGTQYGGLINSNLPTTY